MNTAEYITNLIAGKVVELAGIGAAWSLIYTRRILLAASPKPQQGQPAGTPEAKRQPAAEKLPPAEELKPRAVAM